MKLENEKLIQKFLLGGMAEEERSQFEERFITDDELFEEIKVVEDELIEKYIRGWMDPAEGASFEKSFLTTRKRRERVENSRHLISGLIGKDDEFAADSIPEETASEDSLWQKISGLFLSPGFAMGAAFAILLVTIGGWLVFQNMGGQGDVVVKKEDGNVLETPVQTISPMPNISPNDQTQNSNSRQNSAENSDQEQKNSNQQPIKTPKPAESPSSNKEEIKKTPTSVKTPKIRKAPPSPVLALFSGTVRSGGGNKVLNLPKGAKGATLQLNLDSKDYKVYHVSLKNADGAMILRKDGIKARGLKISFFVGAKDIKKGDYMVNLFGRSDSGEKESVADFQFRVN